LTHPAVYRLLGRELDDGWLVTERVGWTVDAQGNLKAAGEPGSGGNFSAGYRVKRGDRIAFLKAIDLSRAMVAADVIGELKKIVDTASFEKAICKLCGDRQMDRVVLALGTGDVVTGPNLQDRVPYIIFELADGDVRRRVRLINDSARASWIFRAIQNAAVGLTQLHSARVAHQDVKPSNLLHFESQGAFKVGDVGRAIQEGIQVPHAEYGIAGDPIYAPPELLYGHYVPDWNMRRFGCDLFMFGSLIAFFFLGQGVTPMLFSKIEAPFLPRLRNGSWQGTYVEALPIIRRAFSQLLEELHVAAPAEFRDNVVSSVRELCEPDPALRGHPLNRRQNQFDLSRYVSMYDLLSQRAAISARGSKI
jgi:eukaryotic-like serine/threonine-protein kinase